MSSTLMKCKRNSVAQDETVLLVSRTSSEGAHSRLIRQVLLGLWVLLMLLVVLSFPRPANAQSFYEVAPQNDLRNLVGAMEYYRLFSRDDSYNGATKQELRSWGATHSSGVNIVVQITDGGKHYEATTQHILGGR